MFRDSSDQKLQYCRAKFVGGLQLFESDPTFYLTAPVDDAHMQAQTQAMRATNRAELGNKRLHYCIDQLLF